MSMESSQKSRESREKSQSSSSSSSSLSSSLFSKNVENAIKDAITNQYDNSQVDSQKTEEVQRVLLSDVPQLTSNNKKKIIRETSNKSQGLEFIYVKMDTYHRYIDDLYEYIMGLDIRRNSRVDVFFEYISVGERGYISDDLGKMIKFVLMAKCALDLLFDKTDQGVVSLKSDVLDKDFSSNDKEEIRQKILKIAKIRDNDYGSFTRTFLNKSGGLSGGVLFFIQSLQTDISESTDNSLDKLDFAIPINVLKMDIFEEKTRSTLQVFNMCEMINQTSDYFYKYMPFALIRFLDHYYKMLVDQRRIQKATNNHDNFETLDKVIESIEVRYKKIRNRKNATCKKIETYLEKDFGITKGDLKDTKTGTGTLKAKCQGKWFFNRHRCRTNINKYRATCMKKTSGGNKRKNKRRKTYKLHKNSITGGTGKLMTSAAASVIANSLGIIAIITSIVGCGVFFFAMIAQVWPGVGVGIAIAVGSMIIMRLAAGFEQLSRDLKKN